MTERGKGELQRVPSFLGRVARTLKPKTAFVCTSWLGLGWLGENGECSNCRSENVEALARWLLHTLGFCLKRQLTFHVGIRVQGNQAFALRSLE